MNIHSFIKITNNNTELSIDEIAKRIAQETPTTGLCVEEARSPLLDMYNPRDPKIGVSMVKTGPLRSRNIKLRAIRYVAWPISCRSRSIADAVMVIDLVEDKVEPSINLTIDFIPRNSAVGIGCYTLISELFQSILSAVE